ncbi:MAG: T9SS type A sorting domain-containing protein [Cyclonatronaceae bacterium]
MNESVSAGSIITIPDFDGKMHEYRVIRRHEFIKGIVSISAASVQHPADVLSVSYYEGAVTGTIRKASSNTYLELYYSNQFEMNMIAEVRPELQGIMECGLDPSIHSLLHGQESYSRKNSASETSEGISAAASVPFIPHHLGLTDIYDDEVVLDILIVYTPAANLWSQLNTGIIELNIANAMSLNQIPLDVSNTGILMRVVHTSEVDYDESAEGVTSSITLRRLAARPDGPFAEDVGFFNNVHEMREQYGADFVAILAEVDDTGGLGYIPTSASGRPDLAFHLTRIQQNANSYTFVHELGHNLGNGHSRNQMASAAGEPGGIFDYSTGWAWQSGTGERTVTVMAYPEGGVRTQFFSSPDLTIDGIFTGSYAGAGSPADNVRSMREVKYIAANYRPTRFEPPFAGLPAVNSVDVTTGLGATDTRTLEIGNSGQSALFWQLDFSAPELLKSVTESTQTVTSSEIALNFTDFDFGKTNPGVNFMNADSDGIVYETAFGSDEGFSAGTFNAINNWKSIFNNSRIRFNIENSNPSTGIQHLRFGYQDTFDSGSGLSVNSPFFGIRPYGTYEVSLDFYIHEDGGTADYRFIFNDDRINNNSAEIVFDYRGFIFVRAMNELGVPGYIYKGNYTYNTYNNFRVVIDSDTHTLNYYLNDNLIHTSGLLSGNIISQFRIYHNNNQTAGGFIDIDNVKVAVPHTGFSWLSSDVYAGNIQPGNNGSINLTFGGADVDPGTYTGTLIIRTNDENADVTKIPVTYTMDSVVSVDLDTGLPKKFTLEQNYPNPFNPSTEIRYTLPVDGRVNLEIFSITGQKIVTLMDDVKPAGTHTISFNASGLASGLYLYRLTNGMLSETRKMMILK